MSVWGPAAVAAAAMAPAAGGSTTGGVIRGCCARVDAAVGVAPAVGVPPIAPAIPPVPIDAPKGIRPRLPVEGHVWGRGHHRTRSKAEVATQNCSIDMSLRAEGFLPFCNTVLHQRATAGWLKWRARAIFTNSNRKREKALLAPWINRKVRVDTRVGLCQGDRFTKGSTIKTL